MTYRVAKARLIEIIEAVTLVYAPQFGRVYKHDTALDEGKAPPGTGRLFYLSTTTADTVVGNYVRGHEWTRSNVRLSVWVPYDAGNPSKFDDVANSVYEELRGPLLDQTQWDQPASTIAHVEGPDEGINMSFEVEVVGDDDVPDGAWCHLTFTVVHFEVPA